MGLRSAWILFALWMGVVPPASAATWVKYAESRDKGDLLLDIDSPHQDGALVVATEKYVPRVASFDPVHHRRYAWEIRTRALNCDSHATALASRAAYDDQGRLISKVALPYDQLSFMIPQPASLTDEMILKVCAAVQARAQTAVVPPPPSAAPPARGRQGQARTPRIIGTGTGWLTSKGYLVTAAHVVEGHRKVGLAQDGEESGEAEVVVADPANDVAILRPHFKTAAHPAIPIADSPAELGEDIFTLGYPAPDMMGLALKLTKGSVNATSGADFRHETLDDARLLQISAPVQSGNSGGPVIDHRGRAIGIVVTKTTLLGDHDLAQNVNYAVKARYAAALISDLPDISVPANRQPIPQGDVPTLAKGLRGAVFLILVPDN